MWNVFFWVFPRRLSFKSRRFGTLYLFHLYRQVKEELLGLRCVLYLYSKGLWQGPAYEDGTDRGFRNIGF